MIGRLRSAPLPVVSLAALCCLSCASPRPSAGPAAPGFREMPRGLSSVRLAEEGSSVGVPPEISRALRDSLDEYLYRNKTFIRWPDLTIRYAIVRFDPGTAPRSSPGRPGANGGLLVVKAAYESAGREQSTAVAEGRAKGTQSIHSAVRECAWNIALLATRDAGGASGGDTGDEPETKTRSGAELMKGWWRGSGEGR